MVYIGIDNGSTGSIGIIDGDSAVVIKTPVKVAQNYTKKKQNISRLDHEAFHWLLDSYPFAVVAMERPMVNPTRFTASVTALRVFEAQLVVLERLQIPYIFIDSKAWQKQFFPEKYESGQTKELSRQVGKRLFPTLQNPHDDYDGILLALYLKLNNY